MTNNRYDPDLIYLDPLHYIQWDLDPSLPDPAPAEGLMYWNSDDGTLNLGMPGGEVNLQIGQEINKRVRNETGSTILNGTPVYISGVSGNKLLITPAAADYATGIAFRTYAVATEDIEHNSDGYVTKVGSVRDVDLSTFVAGQPLYLAKTPTPGNVPSYYSTTPPTAPDVTILVSVVEKATAGGIMDVRITSIPNLNSLSDVDDSDLTTGNILVWDNTGKTWDSTLKTSSGFLIDYDDDTTTGLLTANGGFFTENDVNADEIFATVSTGVPPNVSLGWSGNGGGKLGLSAVDISDYETVSLWANNSVIQSWSRTDGGDSTSSINGPTTIESALQLASGSITDTSGAISFGDEDLTTEGYLRFSTETPSTGAVLSYKTDAVTPTITGVWEIADSTSSRLPLCWGISLELNPDGDAGTNCGGQIVAIQPSGSLTADRSITSVTGLFGGVQGTIDNDGGGTSYSMPTFQGLAYSTWNDSDFVGAPSKVSRTHDLYGARVLSYLNKASRTVSLRSRITNYAGYYEGLMEGTYNESGVNTSLNYGLYAKTTNSLTETAGTINSYGLFIDACASGAVVNSFGLYQASDVDNVINGQLAVGSTTVPSVSLEVTGESQLGTPGTNYSKFETDGTLEFNGDAEVWDDILGPINTNQLVNPSARIQVDNTESSVTFKSTCDTGDWAWMNVQMSHSWKQVSGANVHPHIHWWQTSANTPNWLVQYRWQRNGDAKTTAWTDFALTTNAFTYVSGTLCQITGDPTGIAPPTGFSISDIIQLRIIRDVANGSGAFSGAETSPIDQDAISVDLHYEKNTVGSRQEFVK
jgi:hypothetical protein